MQQDIFASFLVEKPRNKSASLVQPSIRQDRYAHPISHEAASALAGVGTLVQCMLHVLTGSVVQLESNLLACAQHTESVPL